MSTGDSSFARPRAPNACRRQHRTLSLERDEFDLEKPLEESLNALTVGVRHAWERVTLVFDEQLRDFENTSELFVPGVSAGRNATDAVELQFFARDRSYDYRSRSHSIQVLAEPTQRLTPKLAGDSRISSSTSTAESRPAARRSRRAVRDVAQRARQRRPRRRDRRCRSRLRGDQRLRLIGHARRSALVQRASCRPADRRRQRLGYRDGRIRSRRGDRNLLHLIVAAGWSTESRKAAYGWTFGADAVGEAVRTDRAGYFARLMLNLTSSLELTASVEDDSIDDPFTLASPTASRRYKIGARRRWNNGLSLSGSYRQTDVDNDRANWLADTEQANLRVSLQRPRLRVSAGYARVDLARRIEQNVTAGTRVTLFTIDYAADSTFADGFARWQLSDRVALGGELRRYDNRGSFSHSRDDHRAFVDVRLSSSYALQIAYRNVDYLEDVYDAYEARIVELALGVDW